MHTSDQQLLRRVCRRLRKVETLLNAFLAREKPKEWYTTVEFGELVDRSSYTVRGWARAGRIAAKRRGPACGKHQEWIVSHAELERFRREGLRPGTGEE